MNAAWTEYLIREGASLADDTVQFDSAETDANATVLVPLVHLGLIRSQGEDSVTLLHNLLSNDVKKLGAEDVQWSSFNTPKGRMLASLLLWSESGGHMIAAAADVHAMLLKKLSMYVLRSKVKLSAADDEIALIGLSGADAGAMLAAAGVDAPTAPMKQAMAGEVRVMRLDTRNLVLAAPMAAAPDLFGRLVAGGARKAGTAAWQLAMIRAGLPLITAATQDEFVAQMLNFDLIGGVSFGKGCYPGQEIVARMQYLGKLKKRMYRVRVITENAPATGTDLYAPDFGDQSVGKLVNVAPAPEGGYEALAVMQTSSAGAGDVHLDAPGGPSVAFLDLPYALPEQ